MRKLNRLTLTLALLLTAVGGAWAQTTVTWDSNTWADWTDTSVKTHTVDGVTITTGGTAYAVKSNDNLYIWVTGNANTLTFSSDTPITRIEMTKATPSTTLRLTPNDGWSVSTDGTTVTWEGTATKSLVCETCTLTVSKIKFYLETAAEPTEVIELKPDADKKVWTLAEMPASNVELQVEYEPTKVTMAANDNTMGTVEVGGESKVEWTADTWQGWTSSTKEYTVDDITMASSQDAYINEYTYEGDYLHSLYIYVSEKEDNASVTFSTTGDPFSRIEFTMIDDYNPGEGSFHGVPNIQPADGWTFSGKNAVWEGEATKSLKLQSCTTMVSKITFFKGAIPDGVTVNGDGTFTVAKTATVKLKATPKEGYKFLYWEDAPTNTNPVREVTIESGLADMTYKAMFEEILYNVTFVDGIEEADEWKADPNAAAKNTEIKVTYTGAKKVIDVKVEKKAAVDPAKAYLKWDADQKKLVATEIPAEVTTVENADAGVEWQAGTYVVEGQVNISGTITLKDDVNLIIKDGAKLTAQKISGNKNISIYGQAQMTGELVVDNSGDDATTSIKTLEVHSAKVTATSSARDRGGIYYIGTINVYGGSVDAKNTAADGGYGIWLKPDGSVNIYGGEVKAVGKGIRSYGYGITAGNTSTVTVNGGKLWAENADKKALNTSFITLKKGEGFTGKIEYSSDNSTWSETVDADAKYVRAGY